MASLIEQVKELRERTLAGFADCKAAIEASNGDMEKAIEWLREHGIAKALKKSGSIAAEGVARVASKGNVAIIFELNSQTDFAAQNPVFLKIVDKLQEIALESNAKSLEDFLATKYGKNDVKTYIMEQAGTIGENVNLRRFEMVVKSNDEIFGQYIHLGDKKASLVVVKNNGGNLQDLPTLARDLAMHAAAMKPSYAKMSEIPQAVQDSEMKLVQSQMAEDPKMVAMKANNAVQWEKIAKGKLDKSLGEQVLEEQMFVKDLTKTVKAYVADKKAIIQKLVRYEVGEGIEVAQVDFAAEVAAQVAAAQSKAPAAPAKATTAKPAATKKPAAKAPAKKPAAKAKK